MAIVLENRFEFMGNVFGSKKIEGEGRLYRGLIIS